MIQVVSISVVATLTVEELEEIGSTIFKKNIFFAKIVTSPN
jgi:hypothetical protein